MEPMELTEGPLLWFANRGTGVVLLLLLTLTTVLGVLSTRGDAGRGLPRFVTQAFHRNVSLISMALLLAHVVTAVVDTYVDIRWWQALVPFLGSTYEPLWLGLGTLALDLMLVIMVTSLLRHRIPHRPWRVIHVLAYGSWGLSLAHGIGIGTDAETGWGTLIGVACIGLVALAVLYRLFGLGLDAWRRNREQHHVPPHVAPAGGHR
jgi:methionine sulfoxide reductase heme-binding subunit